MPGLISADEAAAEIEVTTLYSRREQKSSSSYAKCRSEQTSTAYRKLRLQWVLAQPNSTLFTV